MAGDEQTFAGGQDYHSLIQNNYDYILPLSGMEIGGRTQINVILSNIYTTNTERSTSLRAINGKIIFNDINKYIYTEDDSIKLSDPDGEDWRTWVRICTFIICGKVPPTLPPPPKREKTPIECPIDKR